PTRNTISFSDRGTSPGTIRLRLPLAFAQRAELLEGRAAEVGIRPRLVADRGGGRLAVVVTGVDARLLGQLHQALQALPHGRGVAALKVGATAAADEQHVTRDDVTVREVTGAAHRVPARPERAPPAAAARGAGA